MDNKLRPVTVTQLNQYVASLLAAQTALQSLWIQGELSNVKRYASGHWYFQVKDSQAQISAVMFKQRAQSLSFTPEDGQKVLLCGRVSLYERDGKYQLYVDTMEPLGQGDLHQAFEQLKEKLKKEGLFSDEHKKRLPGIPRRIGVVTSSSGAVIRDIINVSRRRYPLCGILLYPCLVQGPTAAASIVAGIEYLDNRADIDVIIVGRGGGSLEDLWPFNEESVARALYKAKTPVISAVGHETDFTICDFVADLRAPTPSAAAELALPDSEQIRINLADFAQRLARALYHRLELSALRFKRLADNRYLTNPYERIDERMLRIERLAERMGVALQQKSEQARQQLLSLTASLDALSPLKVLSRGYAMVTAEHDNLPIAKAEGLGEGQKLRLWMQDGIVNCKVEDKESYPNEL